MVLAPSLAAITAMMALYTNQNTVMEFLNKHVDPNWEFTQYGNTPFSGTVHTVAEAVKASARLQSYFKPGTYKNTVAEIRGGAPTDFAVVEFTSTAEFAECKDDSKWRPNFVWILNFDDKGRINKVHSYHDTEVLHHITEDCKPRTLEEFSA